MRFDDSELQVIAEQVADRLTVFLQTQLRHQAADALAGRLLLSKRETAQSLGVSEATVDRLRKQGLPAVKLDGRVMFRRTSLERWAEAQEGAE